jgi:hypothetical protein
MMNKPLTPYEWSLIEKMREEESEYEASLPCSMCSYKNDCKNQCEKPKGGKHE